MLIDNNISQLAINLYGTTHQKIKSIEELGELIHALSRNLLGNEGLASVTEEMADVHIMLRQMEIMYGNSLDVQIIIHKKQDRLRNIINDK